MQSSFYNFYCLNTLAKNFYRLNPTLSYANYKISITSDIHISSISNIIPNKIVVFDTVVQSKNKKFFENVIYCQPDKNSIYIKYNIDIFNNLSLDTSLKFIHSFDNKKIQKMNQYFWSNLSFENQTEINKINELLNRMELNLNNDFLICK